MTSYRVYLTVCALMVLLTAVFFTVAMPAVLNLALT